MDRSTRLWLVVSMIAVLAGAQLLERRLAARHPRPRTSEPPYQALLTPLDPADLPPIPGRREPPRLQRYTVKPGDTLGAIAQRFLGTARAYRLLLELNRDRLERPSALRAGMQLLVPDPAWLRQRQRQRRHAAAQRATVAARRTPPAEDRVRARSGHTPPPTSNGHAAREYVVRPGDTLGAIAQRQLGSVRHLPRLIAANQDRLEDPGRLRVGMRLRLPVIRSAPRPTDRH